MKTNFIIIFIVSIILLVGGLGIFMNKDGGGSSKYDDFAKALKNEGAQFYGAFWCPHCQDQKADFGSSKKLLPYIECANPDNSPKQVCIDAKIESYPTWRFKEGVIINSSQEPLICEIKTENITETEVCRGVSSENFRTWVFPDIDFSIKSPSDPVKEGTTWKFPVGSEVTGRMSLSSLADQIKFELPE